MRWIVFEVVAVVVYSLVLLGTGAAIGASVRDCQHGGAPSTERGERQ